MRYRVIQCGELSGDLVERWASIQQAHRDYCSPYFRPEFAQAVAAVRDDVHVCVLEDGGRVCGFFPFHRGRGGLGRPLGLGLSDYHGVIAEPEADWSVEPLLRGCGLVRYEFDHLLASQKPFEPYHARTARSPITQLADGYDAFFASRDKGGRKQIREAERKHEKLRSASQRVRFVEHETDAAALQQLMNWKSQQCRRTGTVDYFALPWCVALIERIHEVQSESFGGMLSCLYADDRLVAAHFVMRSARVWHSWFPSYDPDFQQYSPGMIVLVEMVKAAADRGIEHIDFGRGVSLYKTRFMTDILMVAEGTAELPSLMNHTRRLRNTVERWSKESTLKPLLRIPGRIVRSIERKRRYG